MESEDKRDAIVKYKKSAIFICLIVHIHIAYFVTTAKSDVRKAQTYQGLYLSPAFSLLRKFPVSIKEARKQD
jgi:hypothetical protein